MLLRNSTIRGTFCNRKSSISPKSWLKLPNAGLQRKYKLQDGMKADHVSVELALPFIADARPQTLDAVPSTEIGSRIIGGAPVQISDYPWQCSLRFSGSHTCGCVNLGGDKILTAAHCTDGR